MVRSLLVFEFLLCISMFVRAQNKSEVPAAQLAYNLGWDGKSAILKVSLEYSPATKDSTVFVYGNPDFGGQNAIFKILQDIDSKDKVKLTPGERKITVYHTDPGLKKISYTINCELINNPKRATLNELFRPVISSNILYLFPRFFMINPLGHPAKAASIQWNSFPPDLPYFISTAAGTAPAVKQTVELSQEEQVPILAGSGLVIDLYKVHGIPYYSITAKNDTVNKLQTDLKPFFKSYFPGLHDFWMDDETPYYYTALLPLLSIDRPWATGIGQKHGFVMKYSGKFDVEKNRVLAHETAHAWIGNRLQIGEDEFDNQWFGEGFNDYVSNINLVKAGIQDKAAFLDYVNKDILLGHYSSKAKDAPNDSIRTKFWTDTEYERLPYRRGFIYAFYFDNQIRLASKGRLSIRDFLLTLYNRSRQIRAVNPAANLTLQDYIEIASKFIPEKQVSGEIATYLIEGKTLDFKKIKLIDGFKVDYHDSIPVLTIDKKINLKRFYTW